MTDVAGYGVCRLALVSLRAGPSDSSTQLSQLLFGDHYEVLQQSGDKRWLYIRVYMDQCEGWIDHLMHHDITSEYFRQINNANFKIVTDVTTSILYKQSALTILLGSIVPISNSELFKMEERFAFNGEAKSLGQKRDLEFLKSIALKYVNAPCQPGGKSPFGIDGAALMQMIFRISGYTIPRFVLQQSAQMERFQQTDMPLPGSLCFFEDLVLCSPHVGLLLDNDRVLHVHGKVRLDHVVPEGIFNPDTGVVAHIWKGYKRILPQA